MKKSNKTVIELNRGQVIDHTGLSNAVEFIVGKLRPYDLCGLKLHLKWHRRRDSLIYGYYRLEDFYAVAAVTSEFAYPFKLKRAVSCKQLGERVYGVCDEEVIRDASEALVWMAASIAWHFLCKI